MPTDYIEIVRRFIDVLQNRKSSEELVEFYHPEVVQIEYPNALTKALTARNLDALKSASDRGMKVLQREHYEIIRAYVCESTVIIEVIWRGVLNVPVGGMAVGSEMKAHFAQFFEFKEGKIIHQRNYDCFEPFG